MARPIIFDGVVDDLLGCAKTLERVYDRSLRSRRMSMGLYAVLKAIEKAKGATVTHTDLLRWLAITQSTLSCHIKVLKGRKLIVSEPIPGGIDPRERGLKLTPAGVGLLIELQDPAMGHLTGISLYDPELQKFLKKLRENLERHLELINLKRVSLRDPATKHRSAPIAPETKQTDLFL